MLIIPPPKYPRKHGRILEARATVPPTPAVLTIASVEVGDFDGPSGHVIVYFASPSGASLNNPVDGGADPAKWTVLFNGTIYQGEEFVFDGGVSLQIFFHDYGSGSGANWISYSADPSDISDTSGAFLGAVAEYPI